MNEREMENLLAAYPKEFFPRKNMVLVDRQGTFQGVGRFDLLFEDEHQTKILMELKARTAKYEDASQVAKYKTALEERGEDRVLMWLVAPSVPKPVRDFMDHIGIEYTEIHVAEYRAVASRHNVTFESEAKAVSSHSDVSEAVKVRDVGTMASVQNRPPFGFRTSSGRGAGDFLDRCDDGAKGFFTAFFEHQKTLSERSRITWEHQSGFSMKFYFKRLGFVEMLWGFPAVNREGATSRNRQCLVFPLDFAFRRGVPEDFLNGFVQSLEAGTPLSGGRKRPSIAVAHLSPGEIEHVFKTVSEFAEAAAIL